MVQFQKYVIPLGQGMDTKSDPFSLPPAKLENLENGIFTKKISIIKRPGYAGLDDETTDGEDITEGRELFGLDAMPVLHDGTKLYSYAEGPDKWIDKGQLVIPSVTASFVATVATDQTFADFAYNDDITVIAYEDVNGVRVTVLDTATGATHVADHGVSSLGIRVRCIAFLGFVYVLWVLTATNEVRVLRISSVNPADSVTESSVQLISDISATYPHYDLCLGGGEDRAFIAYCQNSTLYTVIASMAVSGQVGSPAPVSNASLKSNISLGLCTSSISGRIFVAAQTASTLSCVWYDSNLVQIGSMLTLDSGITSRQVTACFEPDLDDDGYQYVQVAWEIAGLQNYNYYTRHTRAAATTLSGSYADTASDLYRHTGIASRAFAVDGKVLINLVHDSAVQPTLFTASLMPDTGIVAKVFPGNAGGLHSRNSHLPQVDVAGDVASFAAIYRNRLAVDEGLPVQYTDKNPSIVRMDFNAEQSPPVVFGRAAYIPGGCLWMFDGAEVKESGFHLFPENITATPSNTTSGTLTVAGTYTYQLYWESFNDSGERELSASASGVQVVLGGSDDTVTITVPSLSLTDKTARLAVTRTSNLGTTRYRVDSPTSPIWNNPATDTLSYVDVISDTSLARRELDYTNAEYDHTSPPAAGIIAAGKERVFLADVAGQPDYVHYSKVRKDGTALSFNDSLVLPVDQDGGPITGLAVMDDSVVVFKERRIFAFSGPGPSNTGLEGDTFSPAQLITSDVGCISQRSVVVSSEGVFFQSHKGIWLLDRQLGLSYVGADMELYNEQTITAATLLPDENRIVFLTSEGRTLNYDYYHRQWSTFTNHEGTAAAVIDNEYHYLKSDGRVRRIDYDSFKDVNKRVKLSLETGWISPFGPQSLWRCKSLYVIGKFRSDHIIRTSMAFNYQDGFVYHKDWDPALALNESTFGDGAFGDGVFGHTSFGDDSFGSGTFGGTTFGGPTTTIDRVYQFRLHMPKQKLQSVKFRFEDITGADAGESFELNYLILEAGPENALHKLSPEKTT